MSVFLFFFFKSRCARCDIEFRLFLAFFQLKYRASFDKLFIFIAFRILSIFFSIQCCHMALNCRLKVFISKKLEKKTREKKGMCRACEMWFPSASLDRKVLFLFSYVCDCSERMWTKNHDNHDSAKINSTIQYMGAREKGCTKNAYWYCMFCLAPDYIFQAWANLLFTVECYDKINSCSLFNLSNLRFLLNDQNAYSFQRYRPISSVKFDST